MRVPGSCESSRIAGRVVLAALGASVVSGPVVGQERPAQVVPPDSIRVHGMVVDRSTGQELPAVEVRFTSLDLLHPATWRGRTESSGRFRTVNLPQGLYQVTLDALGFTSLSREILLTGASEVDLRIDLVPDALELDPVVVTTLRRTRLERSGFEQRRRLGLGHIFTREEIEQRNPALVSDLLRMVPGTEIRMVRGRGEVRLRNGCIPDLVVNGIRVPNPGPIDDVVSVGDLAALEVYHGGAGTLTLLGSNCGTIMAWTREGGVEDGDGEIPRLDRLVVALAVVALGFLFTR